VFTPASKPFVEFSSSEEINNYLLSDAEVQSFIESRCAPHKVRPMVAMVFFDEETERICAELDYDLILPSDSLRRHLDSKIVTTKLGEEAGAPSVPNVLDRANSYAELTAKATGAGLGSTWSCRPRTATRERPRSSSPAGPNGIATATTSSART
jgi:biotin carboxylase